MEDVFSSEKSITDSCSKDSWWVEAIKVAEDIENTQKSLDLTKMVSHTYKLLYFYCEAAVEAFVLSCHATLLTSLNQIDQFD